MSSKYCLPKVQHHVYFFSERKMDFSAELCVRVRHELLSFCLGSCVQNPTKWTAELAYRFCQ